MPRIRSVHPDICDDEVLAEVTAYAERTFIRLWTHLDDKGRGLDNPKLWKGKLYPLHDDVTSERVERDLTELAACGLLIRYEVDGRRYLCAKADAWAKYQKPQHPTPSKLPEPPDTSAALRETSGGLTSPHPGGVGSGVGEESSGQGGEGESEGEARAASAHPQAVSSALVEKAEAMASRHLHVIPDDMNPAAGGGVSPSCPPAANGGAL